MTTIPTNTVHSGAGATNNIIVTLAQALSTGSNIIYGTTVPDTSDGELGDFYIDTITAQLHGPRGTTTWPATALGQFVPTPAQTYTETNVVATRAYDADATSVAELADVLGALIGDLRTAGVIL